MSDGNTTYVHLFTELVRAVIRQLRGHAFPLSFPLTPRQVERAKALIDSLMDSRPEEDDVKALQAFLFDMVRAQTFEPWSNMFQMFFALLALRVDGTYACASDLSPELAKLNYLINATCMAEALNKPGEEQAAYDPFP